MDKAENGREMTYGEEAVGLTFNPSGDEAVHHIKQLCAKLIDHCNDARTKDVRPEAKRLYSFAITETQTAQMWAVKAATWRD